MAVAILHKRFCIGLVEYLLLMKSGGLSHQFLQAIITLTVKTLPCDVKKSCKVD